MGLDSSAGRENGHWGKYHKYVHPLQRYSSYADERRAEEKPTSRAYLLNSHDDEFGDPSMSPSRKSMPCRFNGVKVESSGVLKRGSVYQSSSEVKKLMRQREARTKPAVALNNESFLSFEIVKRPSAQNQGGAVDQEKRRSRHLLKPDGDLNSFGNAEAFLDQSFRLLPEDQPKWNSQHANVSLDKQSSSDRFLEISLDPESADCSLATEIHENAERFPHDAAKSGSTDVSSSGSRHTPLSKGYGALPKSFSAKVGRCSTLLQLEIDLPTASQKNRLTPIRKMWDPMKKSKSQRNPSLSNSATHNLVFPSSASCKEDQSSKKSSLSCSSASKKNSGDLLTSRDQEIAATAASAAHLHGTVKLESEPSVAPSFEFSLGDAEEFLSAKTWGALNALNWVYTFHSRKKNSGSSWGSKDRRRQVLPAVGQMHASCYFCSELSSSGSLDNFAVTEFVLQDTSQLKKKSIATNESYPSPDLQPRKDIKAGGASRDPDLPSDPVARKNPSRVADADFPSEVPAPQLDIAAIIVQIPFVGKRSLRDKMRDDACDKAFTATDPINPKHVSVKVVTSSGRHGVPCTDETCPSPLLERWRAGGGCDCGGWDMACPITVLDNNSGGQASTMITGNHLTLKLFVQGAKDKTPALTINTASEDGQFSVHFHAQFSKLQAFSICVAVLHSLEAFGQISQERNEQRLPSNSLKVVLEEEVRNLLDAVAMGEQRKVGKIPSTYLVDPPFSPIGRV